MRWTMLPPILPRPTKPICTLPHPLSGSLARNLPRGGPPQPSARADDPVDLVELGLHRRDLVEEDELLVELGQQLRTWRDGVASARVEWRRRASRHSAEDRVDAAERAVDALEHVADGVPGKSWHPASLPTPV